MRYREAKWVKESLWVRVKVSRPALSPPFSFSTPALPSPASLSGAPCAPPGPIITETTCRYTHIYTIIYRHIYIYQTIHTYIHTYTWPYIALYTTLQNNKRSAWKDLIYRSFLMSSGTRPSLWKRTEALPWPPQGSWWPNLSRNILQHTWIPSWMAFATVLK